MKNQKGFTLIELLIVIALLGMVLLIIFQPITFAFKNFDIQNQRVNTISDARAAMDYLTREIRKGNIVEVVDAHLTIDSKVYKLENRILLKDDMKVVEGIDEFNIQKNDKEINIEIIVYDSRGKDYKLSSDINLR